MATINKLATIFQISLRHMNYGSCGQEKQCLEIVDKKDNDKDLQ